MLLHLKTTLGRIQQLDTHCAKGASRNHVASKGREGVSQKATKGYEIGGRDLPKGHVAKIIENFIKFSALKFEMKLWNTSKRPF